MVARTMPESSWNRTLTRRVKTFLVSMEFLLEILLMGILGVKMSLGGTRLEAHYKPALLVQLTRPMWSLCGRTLISKEVAAGPGWPKATGK